MNQKEVLKKLNSQYFKSFSRFEHDYHHMSDFDEKVKKFNQEYLRIISAVLKDDVDKVLAAFKHSWIYFESTLNEKEQVENVILRKWW